MNCIMFLPMTSVGGYQVTIWIAHDSKAYQIVTIQSNPYISDDNMIAKLHIDHPRHIIPKHCSQVAERAVKLRDVMDVGGAVGIAWCPLAQRYALSSIEFGATKD